MDSPIWARNAIALRAGVEPAIEKPARVDTRHGRQRRRVETRTIRTDARPALRKLYHWSSPRKIAADARKGLLDALNKAAQARAGSDACIYKSDVLDVDCTGDLEKQPRSKPSSSILHRTLVNVKRLPRSYSEPWDAWSSLNEWVAPAKAPSRLPTAPDCSNA